MTMRKIPAAQTIVWPNASTVLRSLQMPLVNLTDIEIYFNFAGLGYCSAIDPQRSTNGEPCIMTKKLDVGKALEKLRGGDDPKTRMTLLDEKNKALDEELRRLRAERRRLERNNPGPPKRD